ncbi:type VII secretion target [Nocardia sp. CA-290969]|uniref:type VII secretion target n=1 Tax=Nocardia sp. CA-290969 TaxID=3239986 RepID=UPI003D8B4FF9
MQVDPEALRTHATAIDGISARLATALQAANYISAADDGYGVIPKPLVDWLLDNNHTSAVEAIRKLTGKVAAVPQQLSADADSFAGADDAVAQALQGLQTTIAGTEGGQ